MKKKIIGIIICMLAMTTIPITLGATVTQDTQTNEVGWTTLQGFIYEVHEINGGAVIEFKCLFVHYVGQGLSQRTTGFRFGGQMMAIPGSFKGLLLPHVIMGWCPGVLEF